jgi:hypothetical protein
VPLGELAAAGRRLAEVQTEIAAATAEWEEAALALEALQEEA